MATGPKGPYDQLSVLISNKPFSFTPAQEAAYKAAYENLKYMTFEQYQKAFEGQEYASYATSLYEKVMGLENAWAPGTNFNSGHYAAVGKALGFTPAEIRELVRANDSGLSFGTIAALIEEHPPIYSSAMTPKRKQDEAAFVKMVLAAIEHHNPKAKKGSFYGFSAGITNKTDPFKHEPFFEWEPYTGKASWKANPGSKQSLAAVAAALMSSPKKSYTTGEEVSPYEGIVKTGVGSFSSWTGNSPLLPKPGEMAKLLGIWTPNG